MASYSKTQNMDSKWQLARKVDRLDLGTFAAIDFVYRNAIIFGIIRGIDPEENEDPKKKPLKTIEQLITSVDQRITDLQAYDTTALMMGKMALPEVKAFQTKTMAAWYENFEIIHRCKLMDNVRVQGEEI
jgi:4-hydroxy-3-methylbut-2-enyl diphosphate reductase IspH